MTIRHTIYDWLDNCRAHHIQLLYEAFPTVNKSTVNNAYSLWKKNNIDDTRALDTNELRDYRRRSLFNNYWRVL